ncbi:MAG: heavy metal-binding domain-containing protein, partial [Aestuariivirga sp.]
MSMDHSGHGAATKATPGKTPVPVGGSQTYTCPMHPEIRRSEPGRCPICGMTLVEVAAPTAAKPTKKGHAMPGMKGDKDTGDMVGDAHRAMLWPHYVAMMLGFWLIAAPFTLGYLSDFVPDVNQLRVMVDRGLTPFAHRNMQMTMSDVVSGIAIVIFGYLSANAQRRYPWAQWANA